MTSKNTRKIADSFADANINIKHYLLGTFNLPKPFVDFKSVIFLKIKNIGDILRSVYASHVQFYYPPDHRQMQDYWLIIHYVHEK